MSGEAARECNTIHCPSLWESQELPVAPHLCINQYPSLQVYTKNTTKQQNETTKKGSVACARAILRKSQTRVARLRAQGCRATILDVTLDMTNIIVMDSGSILGGPWMDGLVDSIRIIAMLADFIFVCSSWAVKRKDARHRIHVLDHLLVAHSCWVGNGTASTMFLDSTSGS